MNFNLILKFLKFTFVAAPVWLVALVIIGSFFPLALFADIVVLFVESIMNTIFPRIANFVEKVINWAKE